LAAAELLAAEGIDAEVIDLRTIRPLDTETLVASVTPSAALMNEYASSPSPASAAAPESPA
jgi:pyruvate dehydrogenase E1 component beta subunit